MKTAGVIKLLSFFVGSVRQESTGRLGWSDVWVVLIVGLVVSSIGLIGLSSAVFLYSSGRHANR